MLGLGDFPCPYGLETESLNYSQVIVDARKAHVPIKVLLYLDDVCLYFCRVGIGEDMERVKCLVQERRCCWILYTKTGDGATVTFNTSDVSNLFIIHLTQHPAAPQHPHIEQRANNTLSSDPFSTNVTFQETYSNNIK